MFKRIPTLANANHPDATVQMQEVAGAAANILLGTAMNGLRTTAEAAATTAPRPTTGTTGPACRNASSYGSGVGRDRRHR